MNSAALVCTDVRDSRIVSGGKSDDTRGRESFIQNSALSISKFPSSYANKYSISRGGRPNSVVSIKSVNRLLTINVWSYLNRNSWFQGRIC